MNLKIRHKLIIMAFLASFLPIIIILMLSIRVKNQTQQELEAALDYKTREDISRIAKDIYNMCKLVYQAAPDNPAIKESLRLK